MSNSEEGISHRDGEREREGGVRTTHLSQARFTGAEEMGLDMMVEEN